MKAYIREKRKKKFLVGIEKENNYPSTVKILYNKGVGKYVYDTFWNFFTSEELKLIAKKLDKLNKEE